MIFPENPVNGQQHKNYRWNASERLWYKNEKSSLILNSSFELPSNARIGESIELILESGAKDIYITQPDDVTIIRGNDHTPTGTSGRFHTRANQTLKFVQLGDFAEYSENYEYLPDYITQRPPSEVRTIALSPDGFRMAISYNYSPYVLVYEKRGGRLTYIGNYFNNDASGNNSVGQQVLAMVFSSDSTKLAISLVGAPYLRLYDFSPGYPRRMENPPGVVDVHRGQNGLYALDWSGDFLAEGHPRGPNYLTIYDFRRQQMIDIANQDAAVTDIVHAVSFSPDGQYLAAGHIGNPILTIFRKVNNVFTKQIYRRFIRGGQIVKNISWTYDSKFLVIINEGNVQVYDMFSGGTPFQIGSNINREPGFVYTAITCAPTRNIIAVASYHEANDNDGRIEFFEIIDSPGLDKLNLPTITGIPSIIHTMRWSISGEHFIVGHSGGANLSVYSAAKVHTNAWNLIHIDGPNVKSIDFETIT